MKFSIPLKDIIIVPGKRIDPSSDYENEVIALIKKTYGFIAETMEVSIHEGMVTIQFKDGTPEKISEAQIKLGKAVKEAQQGRLLKALKLFQEVLVVIPEHVDARRNLAKIYHELGNLDKAKKHLTECLQIDPKDSWSYIMLGNIYARDAKDIHSGCRTLARITGDWRPIDQLAQECLEWFKFINPEGLRREGLKLGLKPKF